MSLFLGLAVVLPLTSWSAHNCCLFFALTLSVVWASMVDASNVALLTQLNTKLIAMRSDADSTVLRLGPAIQAAIQAKL